MKGIEDACYWLSRGRPPQSSPLKTDSSTDIAIVGAGFTGLWTAHFLKSIAPEQEIAVVEQGVTGYGASGRNAGIISNCIDHTHSLAIKHFGLEEAQRLAAIGLKNIDELEEFADGCDMERTGQLFIALKDKHLEDLQALVKTAENLNIPGYAMLDQKQARSRLNSHLYKGAAFVPGGGVIDPIKLVDKLKTSTESLGVKFYERTKISALTENGLQAEGCTLSARKIILATDAYSHHLLPELLPRFIPLYDYIIVSEPLSESQLRAIGWAGREGITDCRTFFNYYRLTKDNRILWGTSEAVYYPPNQVGEKHDQSQSHNLSLKASFDRHFPELSNLKFPYSWGGPIASTTRLTPFFGTARGGKVIYGMGYTGHGIGSTRLAGKILAHMALERDSELLSLKLVKNKPMPYPPEPLRGMAVNMVTNSLRNVDAGKSPDLLLRFLDLMGIGFSS